MRILMVTAEMAPFAKVGGLADVTDALSRALAVRGHDVRVVLPLFGHLDREKENIRLLKKLPPLSVRVGHRVVDFRVYLRGSANAAVKVYLLEAEDLFAHAGIYTDAAGDPLPDALSRAALHGAAALALPRLLDWPVDIVHAHDAEAVPALLFRRHWYSGRELPGPAATVLTIHNLAHQEIHPADGVEVLGLPAAMASYPGLLEFHGHLNLLKAGILAADQLNTVSPTYARETTDDPRYGCGLEGVLGSRGKAYRGILNGGDYGTWNPARDTFLAAPFGPGKLKGKTACRRALLKELTLKAVPGKPLCGLVGRLVAQKGIGLLLPLLDRLAADGYTFAILGTGDRQLEAACRKAAGKHPDRVAFVGSFDEGLAHRIYAGSDLFLMPSEFEPCGLSQMYALRYGTPPLVRRTGGLADTVIDADHADGVGFVFTEAQPEALLAALRRAEAAFGEADVWSGLQDRGMAVDFSWDLSAAGYEAMYADALTAASGSRKDT